MLKIKVAFDKFTPQVHEALNELQHLGNFKLDRYDGMVCYSVDYMDSKLLPIFIVEQAEIDGFVGAIQVPLSKLDEIVPEDFPCNVTNVTTVELIDEVEVKDVKEVAVKWRDYAIFEEGLSDAIIMIGQYDLPDKNHTVANSELFYKFVAIGNVMTKSEIDIWRVLNIPAEETEEIL